MKAEQIIEVLKNNVFHYDGMGEWKMRNWNFEDIAKALESEQPDNTTSVLSEKDEFKLITKLDIIYIKEQSEMSGLPMSNEGFSEAKRISDHYGKKKLELIKSLTSTNQPKEGKEVYYLIERTDTNQWASFMALQSPHLPKKIIWTSSADCASRYETEEEANFNRGWCRESAELNGYKVIVTEHLDMDDSQPQKADQQTEWEEKCPQCGDILMHQVNSEIMNCVRCGETVKPQKPDSDKGAEDVLIDVYGCKDLDDLKQCFLDNNESLTMILKAMYQFASNKGGQDKGSEELLLSFVYWLNSEKSMDIKSHYDIEEVREFLDDPNQFASKPDKEMETHLKIIIDCQFNPKKTLANLNSAIKNAKEYLQSP